MAGYPIHPIHNREPKGNGYSFVEMIIALAILGITLLMVFGVMISQRKALKAEDRVIDMTRNTRVSLDVLLREIRMAGYKVLEEQFLENLSSWVPSDFCPAGVSLSDETCPIVTEGSGTNPDMITLFTADAVPNHLFSAASSGSSTITVDPNSLGYIDANMFRAGDIIRIGDHTEFAKVVSVSGQTLTIDTDPTTTGYQGLAESYPAGEPVRKINVITYTVLNDANDPSCLHHTAGHTVLVRKCNQDDYLDIAEDVEDLQVIPYAPPRYKLKLVTRTETEDTYVAGDADGYKRTDLLVDFRLRNFKIADCMVASAPYIVSLTGIDATSPCTIHVTWSPVTTNAIGETLTTECAVSDYIVTYATEPDTRFYTAYPGTSTSCDLNVSSIMRDPNHSVYYIGLAAVNCSGVSNYSTELTITDTSQPSAVSGLAATPSGHAMILSWTANPECDVIEYRIYRRTNPTGPFSLHSTMEIVPTGVLTTYTWRDEDLPCTTYYYLVRAFDITSESSDSNIAYNTITDTDPPAVPTDFSFTVVGSTVSVYWTVSIDDPSSGMTGDNDVTGYHIYAWDSLGLHLLNSSVPAGASSVTIATQGYSWFGMKAVDICGNLSYFVTQPLACTDALIISITTPSSGATVQGTVQITGSAFTASTSSTLVDMRLRIDNATWLYLPVANSWSYSWDTTTVANGDHTILLRVRDSEGCFEATSITVNVQNTAESADTTPPSIGTIYRYPETDPVDAGASVEICVPVSDYSGIFSVELTTNYGDSVAMTDYDADGTYCGLIPPHDGCTVNFTITATDNSPNQNQTAVSSSYTQAAVSDMETGSM